MYKYVSSPLLRGPRTRTPNHRNPLPHSGHCRDEEGRQQYYRQCRRRLCSAATTAVGGEQQGATGEAGGGVYCGSKRPAGPAGPAAAAATGMHKRAPSQLRPLLLSPLPEKRPCHQLEQRRHRCVNNRRWRTMARYNCSTYLRQSSTPEGLVFMLNWRRAYCRVASLLR